MLYIICVAIIMFFATFLQMMVGEGLQIIYLTLLTIIIILQIISLIKADKKR